MAQFAITYQEKSKTKTDSVEAKTLDEAIKKVKATRPRAKHVRAASGAVNAMRPA